MFRTQQKPHAFGMGLSAQRVISVFRTQQKNPSFGHGVIITTRNFCVLHTAKNPRFGHGVLALFDAWQCPTLAWGDPTLPSALRRFTSEFG
uniref:hypothetical protein n=1 Tax=Yersinia pseudotuberculosis TaxID=633 RepID=UPI001A9CD699